jgi:hypothetical protein
MIERYHPIGVTQGVWVHDQLTRLERILLELSRMNLTIEEVDRLNLERLAEYPEL